MLHRPRRNVIFQLATLAYLSCVSPSDALEPVAARAATFGSPLRERAEPSRTSELPACYLAYSTNGTAASYRWYNVCSGYIWIYREMADESVGVRFGGPAQPEVSGDNAVKRAITYFRNVGYGYTADVYVDVDVEGDGCPDYNLATELNLMPGLRWNCSEFGVDIPCGVEYLIVRVKPDPPGSPPYAGIVSLATDGPFTAGCDPNSPGESFYYGVGVSACIPWLGSNGNPDNFLFWLILDTEEPCPPNAISSETWGKIKRLFR